MKSCPTCNRTFSDETLSFCLVDGAILSAPFDPHATLTIPEPRQTEPPPTEVLRPEIPPTIASPQPSTLTFDAKLVGRQDAPASTGQPRKKTVLIWLIPIIGICLLVALIYSLSGRGNAGNTSISNKGRSASVPSEDSTTPLPVASASAATATPTPTMSPAPSMNRTDNNPRIAQPNSNGPSTSQGDQERAIESVLAILRRNAGACKISKVLSVSAERTAYGWRVTAKVVMAASGNPLTETAVWNVSERNGAVPADQLTAEVGHGCG
jgi:hypothetical protein